MARRPQKSPESRIVEGFIVFVVDIFKTLFQSGPKKIDAAAARQLASHWSQVEHLLSDPRTAPQAVSEADKLLDAALQACNIAGSTMGERLKAAESRLGRDITSEVWRAHKLRNQLAHEVGTVLAPGQANTAVRGLQKGLRKLGIPL